jgi:uncharacterized protein YfbU (UPF0304 family)
MELTQTERMILANQYKILGALFPEEAKEYAYMRETVVQGYEIGYSDLEPGLTEPMSEGESREVLDILEMFSQLKYTYDNLEDKSGIKEYSVKFRGFDGNNEFRQLHYATHFCRDGERFRDLDIVNSHAPLLGSFRRMLVEWEKTRPEPMTKEDVIRITEAAVHPENRKT